MEILIAETAGFCFGVKRAVDMAFKAAEKGRGRVATFGPIIHNPQVIQRLSETGVVPVEEIGEDIDLLIIRTHGIPRDTFLKIQQRGIDLIDATCPFVKKAQEYAKLLKEGGYRVIILGDSGHPEVKGILSYAGEDAVVVKDATEIKRPGRKVGIVVQTTQPVERLKELVSRVVETAKEVKVYNTICNSTAMRLRETEELASEVDVMFVVGGKNSANTKQLAHLCKRIGVNTYHIETAEEIRPEWIKGIKKAGITAGASTPDWIISEVKERLEQLSTNC